MQNVDIKVEGKTMTITVDLTKRLGISRSGKSQLIATTSGNQSFVTEGGNVSVGVNIYTLLKENK